MGYESKLYVVDKKGRCEYYDSKEKEYAEVIAMFDICKFNGFDGIFKKETDCYIYADDGNTEILYDMYEKPLKEESVENVIEYLEKYKKEGEYYRRVDPLLALLKGFNVSNWNNLVVLHFGY